MYEARTSFTLIRVKCKDIKFIMNKMKSSINDLV